MTKLLRLLVIFMLPACVPPAAQGLTISTYVDAMRGRDLHDIRVENNQRLGTTLKVTAADVYVGVQHVIVLQAPPGREGTSLAGYFDGYKAQKYTIAGRHNLLLVADPGVQKEIVEAFEALQ